MSWVSNWLRDLDNRSIKIKIKGMKRKWLRLKRTLCWDIRVGDEERRLMDVVPAPSQSSLSISHRSHLLNRKRKEEKKTSGESKGAISQGTPFERPRDTFKEEIVSSWHIFLVNSHFLPNFSRRNWRYASESLANKRMDFFSFPFQGSYSIWKKNGSQGINNPFFCAVG